MTALRTPLLLLLIVIAALFSSCATTTQAPRVQNDAISQAKRIFKDPNQDNATAYAILEEEARKGNAYAALLLGTEHYFNADGDAEQGIHWLEYAAANGEYYARNQLIHIYLDSTREPYDLERGQRMLEEAAVQANPHAMALLAESYMYGVKGYEKDYEQAYYWLDIAKDYGYFAARLYGDLFMHGWGVEADQRKARHWLNKANEMHKECCHEKPYYDAIADIARSYAIDENYSRAYEEAMKALEDNDCCAHTLLGEMYQDGLGVEQNTAKARDHYEQAAKQNCPYGKEKLAALDAQSSQ